MMSVIQHDCPPACMVTITYNLTVKPETKFVNVSGISKKLNLHNSTY